MIYVHFWLQYFHPVHTHTCAHTHTHIPSAVMDVVEVILLLKFSSLMIQPRLIVLEVVEYALNGTVIIVRG